MSQLHTQAQHILRRCVLPAGSDGCWIWQGALTSGGYGSMWDPRTKGAAYVHRVIYEIHYGRIPVVVDHLCRMRACCNPTHLESVTHAINHARSEPVQRTHCPQGHMYTTENTYWSRGRKRQCRACHRTQEKQRRSVKALGR